MKKNYYIIRVNGAGKRADEYVILTPVNGTIKKLGLTENEEEATALSFEDCELYCNHLEGNFKENYHQTISKIKI